MGFSLGNTLGAIGNIGVGYFNYQLAKKQYGYQKRLQRQLFQREDTAAQRRAADLEAAGLSKTLAAGGTASAGPVVSTTAPRMEIDINREAMNVLALQRGKVDIDKTLEDTRLTQLQQLNEALKTENISAETDKKRAEIVKIYTEARKQGVDIKRLLHDLAIAEQSGMRTNASGIPGYATDIGAAFRAYMEARRTREAKEKKPEPVAIPESSRTKRGPYLGPQW